MVNSQWKLVETLEHLYTLLANGVHEYAIVFEGGLLSRKVIYFEGDKFEIENCIDDSEQELTEAQLMDRENSNIGYALTNGALYYYE